MSIATDDALSGVIVTQRVQEIITHERSADEHEAKADGHRWEAARLVAGELDSGKSQRQLAREIGHKGHTHVNFMAKVWERWGGYPGNQLPAFNDAYQQAKRGKQLPSDDTDEREEEAPKPAPEPTPEPPKPEPEPTPVPERGGVTTWSQQVQAISASCPMEELTSEEVEELFGAASFLRDYCKGERVGRKTT